MTRPRRSFPRVALLALAAVAAVTGAGCSAAPPDATATTGAATAHDRAVRFAECMRANGVSGFPDPDPSGELTLDGVVNGSAIEADGAVFTGALAACEHLEPAGFTGPDDLTTEQLDARLAFARCVRANGVPDFPDPEPDAPLVDTNRIPSSGTPGGMAVLDAAMAACGDHAAVALGER